MKYVVIRDDDICSFTRPEMLDILYKPLLEAGKSVSLSVIPAIQGGQPAGRLNGPFWEQFGLTFSPCLPPLKRSEKKTYALTPESEIVKYLLNTPEYEIVQHGYNHISIDGIREGMLTDARNITDRITLSRNILKECFGKESDFFVAPWDDVSYRTMRELRRFFKGISLHRVGQRHVSLPRKISAAARRFQSDQGRKPYFCDGDFLLLEYPGPILSMFCDFQHMKAQVSAYLEQHDILILVTHYWEYFWDWDKANKAFISTWHDIASYLLDRPDIEIVRFTDLYEHIYS